MVCILVLAVLTAIIAPALSRSRESARRAECLSALRTVMFSAHEIAGCNGGWWPTLARPGDPPYLVYEFQVGHTAYLCTQLQQVLGWPGAFIGSCWDVGSSPKVWSCPSARRRYAGQEQGFSDSPAAAAILSYYSSAALFSDPSLWDPANEAARADSVRLARPVGVHEVAFPSRKISLVESVANHGNRRMITAGGDVYTCGWVDGHASGRREEEFAPTLKYDAQPYAVIGAVSLGGRSLPGNATVRGAHGMD